MPSPRDGRVVKESGFKNEGEGNEGVCIVGPVVTVKAHLISSQRDGPVVKDSGCVFFEKENENEEVSIVCVGC